MERWAWQATVHGVANVSDTTLQLKTQQIFQATIYVIYRSNLAAAAAAAYIYIVHLFSKIYFLSQ